MNAGVLTLALAAVCLGFLLLWSFDHAIPFLGRFFFLSIRDIGGRIYLAGAAAAAIAGFLLVWNLVLVVSYRRGGKTLWYFDAYMGYRRTVSRLARRWRC